jgi:hypothetical protein
VKEKFRVEFLKEAADLIEALELFKKTYYRLLASWDKTDKTDTVVISTHGLIKKTGKIPPGEIEKAERTRKIYFEFKEK